MSITTHQKQRLPVHMQRVGGDGCQEALQHPQLHAIVCNVIASAQQLHSLRLRRHNSTELGNLLGSRPVGLLRNRHGSSTTLC